MKVLILDSVHPSLPEGLRAQGYQVDEDYASPKSAVEQKLNEYTGIIIRSRFPVDSGFLKNGDNLRFIGRVGAGMENIDVAYAESRKIHLVNAPEGNRDAVGEQAIGMLLMLFNNLKRADAEVRRGEWKREENRGHEMQGKTVGIIGFGNMGSAFAEKLSGFGVRILAYDKYKSGFGSENVQEASLEKLWEESDILSLHIPQTEETMGMVNDEFIRSFKKDLYLINTARGKVVKTSALVKALQSGKIKGACLDVLEYEKASFENLFLEEMPEDFRYLVNSEKVILSPHIAGWSFESNEKMAKVILDKIEALKL